MFEILNSEILLSDHNLWSFYQSALFHALEICSLVSLGLLVSWPLLMLAAAHPRLTPSLALPCSHSRFCCTVTGIQFSHSFDFLFYLSFQSLANNFSLPPLPLPLLPIYLFLFLLSLSLSLFISYLGFLGTMEDTFPTSTIRLIKKKKIHDYWPYLDGEAV